MIPEIETLPFLELASGDILALQIYKFIGSRPGKKAYVQANLHGAEIVGNAAIDRLIRHLSDRDREDLHGDIWLVPACNPIATNARAHNFASGRYDSYTGYDWNRIFWDYENVAPEEIAAFARQHRDADRDILINEFRQTVLAAFATEREAIACETSITTLDRYRYCLQGLCLDADYVLDLHSSSNCALDYLYCFGDRQESAAYLGFDWGILMNEYDGDAFDEAFMKPWLALERELAALGREMTFDIDAWTLELGSGMRSQPESVERGFRGILSYLTHKQMIRGSLDCASRTAINLVSRSQFCKYYAPRGGFIKDRRPLGDRVAKGDCLYTLLVLNKTGKLPETVEVRSRQAGIIFDRSTSESFNQGEYVLTVVEDPSF